MRTYRFMPVATIMASTPASVASTDFWESRIPELLAEKEWDFFIGKALYISQAWRFYMEAGVRKCRCC
jgi:type IV secretory pathway TrbF-like protein